MSDREELVSHLEWTIEVLDKEINKDNLTENADYVIGCVVEESLRTLERVGETYPREEQQNAEDLNHQK